MKITEKQAHVLDNLHKIVLIQGSHKWWALLDGEDCRYQLVSLAAKRVIAWDGRGRPVKIAQPEGIMAHAGRVQSLAHPGRNASSGPRDGLHREVQE